MKITANDIRQKRSALSDSGLNATEARDLLDAVAEALEALERDNDRLREALATSQRESTRPQGEADAGEGLRQLMDDINELKRQRLQFESQLEALLTEHLKLLAATRSSASQIDVEAAFPVDQKDLADRGDIAGERD